MAMTKTPQEIEKMRAGGALLSRALKAAVDEVRPGVMIADIDAAAEKVIRDGGGEPSFKGYKTDPSDPPFPSTVCISINHEVVHGTADRPIALKEGDIVGLDIGCWYEGLCTDMAVSVPVGKVSHKAMELMKVTRASLEAGIAAVKIDGYVEDISRAVESYIKPHHYGIVRALVGHGVGHKVHESPHVPNFVDPRYPRVKLKEGMCLAIEPMVTLGDWHVETADDGWTVVTKDGSLAAHFEMTIALTKNGVEILTPLPV